MNWFRWYTGAVSDPKFQVVARKSRQTVASVVAVWALILERASESLERGAIDGFDCEGADAILGLDDGAACAIFDALRDKGLLVGDRVAKWELRQPKKEDITASDRKRAQRERERDIQTVTPCHAMSRSVTPCHDRVEESREDINTGTPNGVLVGDAAADHADHAEREIEIDTPRHDDHPTSRLPDCQVQALIAAYHDELEGHPRVEIVNAKRQKAARARWIDAAKRLRQQGKPVTRDALLEYFRRYFHHAAQSDFLTGRVHSRDRPPFLADFDFLLSPKGFAGVIEGKYHQRGLLQ